VNQPSTTENDARPRAGSPVFVTTRWSVVVAAQCRDSPGAAQALEHLCQAYWYPLYAHVRRAGHSPADAEDLTQAFFARLLAKDWLAVAERERGRFRSFLLGALKHFLANEWDKARAQKRGGHLQIVSLDAPAGEDRLQHEAVAAGSPDREFDRRWVLALLDTVLGRLADEYRAAGKATQFERLKPALGGDRSEVDYALLSQELAMSEGAARVAVHRLRQRYRELLRDEIAQTVATADEVETELRHLFAALSD
jgi:RNA polymerase sigma factor (sigma-70 family)